MEDNPIVAFLSRRRSASALGLEAPGPDGETVRRLLTIATRVPDHGKLSPWRFVLIEGEAKERLVDKLEAIAATRDDATKASVSLRKLARPPLCIAVISRPKDAPIPEWEQVLSSGAVCMNLLTAALAMGFGANWITDWYSYDSKALELLGVGPGERVAGMVMIGTAPTPPEERPRPDVSELTSSLEI